MNANGKSTGDNGAAEAWPCTVETVRLSSSKLRYNPHNYRSQSIQIYRSRSIGNCRRTGR